MPSAGQASTEVLLGPGPYSIPCAIVPLRPRQSPSVRGGLLSNALSARRRPPTRQTTRHFPGSGKGRHQRERRDPVGGTDPRVYAPRGVLAWAARTAHLYQEAKEGIEDSQHTGEQNRWAELPIERPGSRARLVSGRLVEFGAIQPARGSLAMIPSCRTGPINAPHAGKVSILAAHPAPAVKTESWHPPPQRWGGGTSCAACVRHEHRQQERVRH